ncbi:hypothetical protein OF83DRAFT_1095898 [Amylostereum chailletii]|nr:hypothetical protein OF83DRAFT_1095898 [Amylostereum chailletii]
MTAAHFYVPQQVARRALTEIANMTTVLTQPDVSSRIRRMRLHLTDALMTGPLSDSLSKVTPLALESLLLRGVDILRTIPSEVPWFNGEPPARPRALELRASLILTDTPILSPFITSLTIHHSNFSLRAPSSNRDCPLVNALRGLPALQSLSISPIVTSERFSFVAREEAQLPVNLPGLRCLTVSDCAGQVAEFLDWLEVPATCTFDLGLGLIHGSEASMDMYSDEASRVMSWFRQHYPPPSYSFESLSFKPRSRRRCTLTLSGLRRPDHDPTPPLSPTPTQIKIHVLNWPDLNTPYESQQAQVVSKLPIAHIVENMNA